MISVFCLPGTSFERDSGTVSQQLPFCPGVNSERSLVCRRAEGATVCVVPSDTLSVKSTSFQWYLTDLPEETQTTLLTRSELSICAQNQWVSVIYLWTTWSSGFFFVLFPGLCWKDGPGSDEWWQTWQGFTVLCCYLTSPLLPLFLGSCQCE